MLFAPSSVFPYATEVYLSIYLQTQLIAIEFRVSKEISSFLPSDASVYWLEHIFGGTQIEKYTSA